MKGEINKLTEQQKLSLPELVNSGLTDSEIAKKFGTVSRSAILYWRRKLGLKTQFTYEKVSKMNHAEVVRLFNLGLSDYKIAALLSVKPCSVFSYRKYHNIGQDRNLKYNKEITPTEVQMQILFGILFGDASLRKTNTNPKLTCAHCIKQKDYCYYKAALLKSLLPKVSYHKRHTADKRTGIYYEDYTLSLPSNPAFLPLYDAFYPQNKKVIPLKMLYLYTEIAMAFHYMDDGYKSKNGYVLCTNCFSVSDVTSLSEFLYSKFGLVTSIWKNHQIYIQKKSAEKFRNLISPYICECMKYKL